MNTNNGWLDIASAPSAQDSTEARTGNTAAEQAAYWRGFEEAQLNAQHNARVRDAASTVADEGAKDEMQWRDGAPPFPQNQEWFIAETTYGDRVVLCALPEGMRHDYKTADGTYLKSTRVKRWMQFPDCEYLPPAPAAGDARDAARYRNFRAALCSLDTTWLDKVQAALEGMGLDPDDDVLPTVDQVDAAFDSASQQGGE